MVVSRGHWWLQETRFLFLTRKGPIEIIVKPSMIVGVAFVGLVGSAVIATATLFVGFKSVEAVRNESITPAQASAPIDILPMAGDPIPPMTAAPTITAKASIPSAKEGAKEDQGVTPEIIQPKELGTAEKSGTFELVISDEIRAAVIGKPAKTKMSDGAAILADDTTPGVITQDKGASTSDIPAVDAPPIQLAAVTAPSFRWPPSLAATDAAPLVPIPTHRNAAIASIATAENLAEPDMMVPIPAIPAEAKTNEDRTNEDEPEEEKGLIGAKSLPGDSFMTRLAKRLGGPSGLNMLQKNGLIEKAALTSPPTRPGLQNRDQDTSSNRGGGDMVPFHLNSDRPILTSAGRQRKLLYSMAREVRNIRNSLTSLGLNVAQMTISDALQSKIENEDFAGLAMAVEEHRSILRKVPLKPPMLYFYISSEYGMRTHPVLKKKRYHHGIDLAGTWQETVHATAPGTVIYADRKGSFGNVVQIRHAYGVITTYAHLSKITVREGTDVTVGTVVGRMGRTGRVDGAHLHYEIRVGDKSLNPRDFFAIGHRIGVGGELVRAGD